MPEKIKLQKFVDELPIPKTLSPIKRSNDWTYFEVNGRYLKSMTLNRK